MIDLRPAIDRANQRLKQLKEGRSAGVVVGGSQVVTGTQIFSTREAAMAAASQEMSDSDRQIMDESSSVVDQMARDFIEQINRGFMV